MTEIRKPSLTPVWAELAALFARIRPDWVAQSAEAAEAGAESGMSATAEAAVLAAQAAGVPFDQALAEAIRIVRSADGSPAELRELASRHSRSVAMAGPGLTREEREELRASYLASCQSATERFNAQRTTGPQPALGAGGDP